MKNNHIKIKLNQNTVKKIVVKEILNDSNPEDFIGYFELNQLGDPEFILETKA